MHYWLTNSCVSLSILESVSWKYQIVTWVAYCKPKMWKYQFQVCKMWDFFAGIYSTLGVPIFFGLERNSRSVVIQNTSRGRLCVAIYQTMHFHSSSLQSCPLQSLTVAFSFMMEKLPLHSQKNTTHAIHHHKFTLANHFQNWDRLALSLTLIPRSTKQKSCWQWKERATRWCNLEVIKCIC